MDIIIEYFSPEWMGFLLDQLKLWLTVFSIDSLRYVLGAGLVSLVLFVVVKEWADRFRIQRRRASVADLRRELLYSFITTAVYACVALFTMAFERMGWLKLYGSLESQSLTYTLLSLPLLLVLHDAYFYWVHRAMHHPSVFRRVHRLHHLSKTPTPWAAYSFAPLEAVAMSLFVPMMLLTLPIHEGVLFVFLLIMIVRNALGHSGVEVFPPGWVDGPLDVMTTVTHHDLHHQRFNGNYGLYFTWWDRWMGTELSGYKACFRQVAKGDRADVCAQEVNRESPP